MPAPFARLVADEDARIQRYRRTATVVMIEVEGLDKLVERLGDTAIDRLIPAVADSIRRNARESDHVARLESGRFARPDARDRRGPGDQLHRARPQERATSGWSPARSPCAWPSAGPVPVRRPS